MKKPLRWHHILSVVNIYYGHLIKNKWRVIHAKKNAREHLELFF
jgi:hypothetical protein